MKVKPLKQEEQLRSEDRSTLWRVISVVWEIARFLGLLPFHQKKNDQSFSFKWFSFTTLFSFTRLVIFNSPFTTLPVILFLIFGRDEWEEEQFEALLGMGNGTMSMSMVETVLRLDYITTFSFYILSGVAKNHDWPERRFLTFPGFKIGCNYVKRSGYSVGMIWK